jgi:phosphotransferase system enzyme I (PtsI)
MASLKMASLKGVGASPGVAIGPVHLHAPAQLTIDEREVAPDARELEIEAFHRGLARAAASLGALIEQVRAQKGDDLAGVFEGHLEILLDEEIAADVARRIREDGRSALAAARDCFEAQRAEFLALEDEYLRQRADDLADIGRRLSCAIAGVEDPQLDEAPDGAIIVAHDLTPSETARLDPARVGGFVTATGGRTSHVAIMARTLEVPAVVGCADALSHIRAGALVALDGETGEVAVDPDPAAHARLDARRAAWLAEREALRGAAHLPARTLDGHEVLLAANIGAPADADAALAWRPDGVGLFRTEFLFMEAKTPPDEETQFRAYAHVARVMDGKPVVIRTIDAGGDKPVAGFGFTQEENPFLGWRGARLFLYGERGSLPTADAEMVRHMEAQIGAILRAGAQGEVWLMWPMIACAEEIDALALVVERVRERLIARGDQVGAVKIGAMIETPGAAMIADVLADKLDFFSIGSNDLTQYALAADRGNPRVAPVYQPFHPGVWRLIAHVIEAAHRRGKPVAVCGELAGMEEAALPLLGLGLDEFSMAAPMLARVKRVIRAASMDEAKEAARLMLAGPTAAVAFEAARAAMDKVLARANA